MRDTINQGRAIFNDQGPARLNEIRPNQLQADSRIARDLRDEGNSGVGACPAEGCLCDAGPSTGLHGGTCGCDGVCASGAGSKSKPHERRRALAARQAANRPDGSAGAASGLIGRTHTSSLLSTSGPVQAFPEPALQSPAPQRSGALGCGTDNPEPQPMPSTPSQSRGAAPSAAEIAAPISAAADTDIPPGLTLHCELPPVSDSDRESGLIIAVLIGLAVAGFAACWLADVLA